MSYTHFNHWGVRTHDQIQRLQSAVDYGTAYKNTNPRLLQDGQGVIDRGLEGVMRWAKNPDISTGSTYYNGCFLSAEFSQWYANSGGFENKWYTNDTMNQDLETGEGAAGDSSDAEQMIGVTYNTLFGAAVQTGGKTIGDFVSFKTSGITDCDYFGQVNPPIGSFVEEGASGGDGKCDSAASFGNTRGRSSNTFGWITSIANQSGTTGSVLIKINATEKA